MKGLHSHENNLVRGMFQHRDEYFRQLYFLLISGKMLITAFEIASKNKDIILGQSPARFP